ncbi:hypothetical protein B0I26_10551 [Anoxybacillus vitaminiphilus]|uniref:Uncharacterized protein n=1 Tax=Paranoxybacillus vitaminiphilus TaxID=581036 RepID=A0A327YNU4_9BACL|nr:hypothetical protein [Anoxybacillus vitaminiphilus]RAK19869.1 hypothetical protein B0I26_10551 [Anoxybacillus vitaminiphilus]
MNLFQMKTRPHGIERLPLFLEKGFVAIGWPGIGSLKDVDANEIEQRLAKRYPSYVGQKMAYYKGIVNAFANTMKAGDLVMITEGDFVHIGQLGDYEYKQEYDNDKDGMCHQRPVHWITTVERNALNDKVQEHLRNRATVTKFKYPIHLAELEPLLHGKPAPQLSDGHHSLAEKAWNVLEEELQSNDPFVRVTAAAAILQIMKK